MRVIVDGIEKLIIPRGLFFLRVSLNNGRVVKLKMKGNNWWVRRDLSNQSRDRDKRRCDDVII